MAHVFDSPVGRDTSGSSQRPMIFGYTLDGRYITVIYEEIDEDTVYPVTAFEVPEQVMAKQITRDRKLTPEEAAKYRKIREEAELEKPEIIAQPQQARCEARRQQLAAIMDVLKAAREAKGLSLADIYQRTGMDRSALSKLENVTNENPTIDTLLRYAEVVGKRLEIQVLDS